jgi:uncharacterized membrane protein
MGIAPQLLPLVLNLVVALFFLVTLKEGNTPLISAIARIEQGGDLPPGLAAYTRRLTYAWGGFLILLGLSHLPLGQFLELHLHPVLQLLIDPFAILCFFALEFTWRVRRFPDSRFASPWKLWRLIRRNGGLYQLYHQCIA